MRIVKLGLISFVFFFLLLTAFSLLLPSQTNISRAIDINAPASAVFNNVNDLAKWKNWYVNYDLSMPSLSQKTVGKGAMLTVNKTVITIQSASRNKIKATWQSGDNNPVEGEFNFFSRNADSSMTLQWNFTQKVKWYPWQKFASIVSNKTIAPFMEKSLENLKREAEKQ